MDKKFLHPPKVRMVAPPLFSTDMLCPKRESEGYRAKRSLLIGLRLYQVRNMIPVSLPVKERGALFSLPDNFYTNKHHVFELHSKKNRYITKLLKFYIHAPNDFSFREWKWFRRSRTKIFKFGGKMVSEYWNETSHRLRKLY